MTSPQVVVQELLEKYEIVNRKSEPLHIHCIDYDRWPKGMPSPVETEEDMAGITRKLQRDLSSICQTTGDNLHLRSLLSPTILSFNVLM